MTHNNSTRLLRVPEGFDPMAVLPETLRKYVDPVVWFVHKVTVGPIYDARTRKERRGWHPVKWEVMNRLFGRSGVWNKARHHLIEAGIVECDEEYQPGVKAKYYRLGPGWIAKDTERRPILDRKFARRLAAHEKSTADRGGMRQPVHDFLTASLEELTIDEAATRRFTSNPRSRKQMLNRMAVEAIKSGEWRLTVCPYGRVHTNVTNLNRKIRKALRWNGTQPTEVDVAGAQPLIIGAMAAGWETGRATIEEIQAMGREGAPDRGKTKEKGGEDTNTLCLLNSRNLHIPVGCLLPLDRLSVQSPDLHDYIETCEAGRFYDAMASLSGIDLSDDVQRSRLKRLTFRLILFGRTRPGHRIWLAFRKKWPTVAGFLELAKRDDYRVPSRASQRLESALMIGGVAARLMAEHPDTPIWTIHDSIMVAPHSAALVKRTIEEVFADCGLRPTVKVKGKSA